MSSRNVWAFGFVARWLAIGRAASAMPCSEAHGVPYGAGVVEAASEAAIDPALLAAIISVESSFDPKARSSAGAVGLTQLTAAAAREVGLSVGPPDERLDPRKAIFGGARYFAKLLRLCEGDEECALSSYHSGPMYARLWGEVPPESAKYVARVLATRARLRGTMRFQVVEENDGRQ